jgi:hypothetical protein
MTHPTGRFSELCPALDELIECLLLQGKEGPASYFQEKRQAFGRADSLGPALVEEHLYTLKGCYSITLHADLNRAATDLLDRVLDIVIDLAPDL